VASRSRRLGTPDGGEPKDSRPIGSFFYADPSTCVFAQNIHRANLLPNDHKDKVPAHAEMYDEVSGAIGTVDRRTLRMHDPMWHKRHPEVD
jgi:hypothetical protein